MHLNTPQDHSRSSHCYCLFAFGSEYQGGFAGRGLNRQSCCWRIESRLRQIRTMLGGMLRIHLCPSHIGQVLRMPGDVSLDVFRFASLCITLTVPEVVGTENRVNSSLPLLLDPSSIAMMQS